MTGLTLGEPDDLDFALGDDGELVVRTRPEVAPLSTFSVSPTLTRVLASIAREPRECARGHARKLELSGLFAPPFAGSPFARGDVDTLVAGLRAAGRLLEHGGALRDPEVTNAALKLFGASLHGADSIRDAHRARDLSGQIEPALTALAQNLATLDLQRRTVRFAHNGELQTLVLEPPPRRLLIVCGERSRTARWLRRSLIAEPQVDWAVWRTAQPTSPRLEYSRACYPPPSTAYSPPEFDVNGRVFDDFAALAHTISTGGYQVGLLAGMPIVPESVLDSFVGPVVNVHNGRIPSYRGMDAVAWALWNQDPIYISAHVAVAAVDAGPVLQEHAVGDVPLGEIRAQVSRLTHQLLLNSAHALLHASAVVIRDTLIQGPEQASLFRMHPLMRRHLLERLEHR